MASSRDTIPPPSDQSPHGAIEMPRPMAWPIVLALGITIIALGVATSRAFCAVGGVLFAIGLVGWIVQLLPGRGHEHEPLSPPADRVQPVVPRPGTVKQLKPGVVGYRFQVPEKVHPVSAGVKGGIVGGLLMPIPALAWGVWSGHGIWFPVNLLAGMAVPGLNVRTVEQLEGLHLWVLAGAIVMHIIMSIGIGLVYGVLLPTLPPIPGGPLLFGGIILPLLWTGASHSLMGVINPVLNQYVAWRWFVVSQLVYGVAASIVILRSEQIPIAPRGPGGDEGGPSLPRGFLGCLIACCIFASGCSDNLPGKPLMSDKFVRPTAVKDFKKLFALRCAGCHGAEGTLGPGPPLNDPMFIALVSDDELRRVIVTGRHGTLMPAWSQTAGGPLTDEQVGVLVTGIKHRQWESTPTAATAQSMYPGAPPLISPGSASGNLDAGKTAFTRACAGCHGENGQGGKFGEIKNTAFLALMSDQILRRYVITGRPDLGMPDFADSKGRGEKSFQPITAQEVNDIVALLADWRTTPKSGN